MPWKRAEFKGANVWAEVDETGALKAERGIVRVRYSNKEGAKGYGGGASRVSLTDGAPIENLPDLATAEAEPSAAKPAKKTSRGSGFGKAGERTTEQAASAHASAQELISGLATRAVLCFTDGACRGNPGPAGAGAFVVLRDGRKAEASRALGTATNNVGELTAIQLALELLAEASVDKAQEVAIFTDSAYAHGVLTKGWKAKANVELIDDVKRKLRAWPNSEIYWIAGHVGVDGNERADVLANMGVAGRNHRAWIPGA